MLLGDKSKDQGKIESEIGFELREDQLPHEKFDLDNKFYWGYSIFSEEPFPSSIVPSSGSSCIPKWSSIFSILRLRTSRPSVKERKRIIHDLHQGKCQYLIATGQLIGEGFDLPEISTIFLTTPVKFSGRLVQYIGRALRPAEGKEKALITDFVDEKSPVFQTSGLSRIHTYKKQGIHAQRVLNIDKNAA